MVVKEEAGRSLAINHAQFVSPYDEADSYFVSHDFLHMSLTDVSMTSRSS